MSLAFDVLWLNASPSLKHFDQSLLRYLSQYLMIAQWEYCQTKDEASSLEKAIMLLHDFLKFRDRPVLLAGHGRGTWLNLCPSLSRVSSVFSLAGGSISTSRYLAGTLLPSASTVTFVAVKKSWLKLFVVCLVVSFLTLLGILYRVF